jgi:hypothetical protein
MAAADVFLQCDYVCCFITVSQTDDDHVVVETSLWCDQQVNTSIKHIIASGDELLCKHVSVRHAYRAELRPRLSHPFDNQVNAI